MTQDDNPATRLWRHCEAVKSGAPLVQNITNLVMQNDTAAAIAAVGGTQLTLHGVEEAKEIAALAHAVAVNPGTLNADWMKCARDAIEVAGQRRIPWVLDPLAVGLSRYRTEAIMELLSLGPTVIKANASELLVLAGSRDTGRGADSLHSVDEAAQLASSFAATNRCIVVVTGDRDLVSDGKRTIRLSNGAPLMGRMIGSGCMLTSIIACFLGASDDRLDAVTAAVGQFTIAGELAAEQANGPGTLKPLLLDALHGLDHEQFSGRLRAESENLV